MRRTLLRIIVTSWLVAAVATAITAGAPSVEAGGGNGPYERTTVSPALALPVKTPAPVVLAQLAQIPIPDPRDLLPSLNPADWAGDILNAILDQIGNALLEAMRGFIDWALGIGGSLNFVTQTPPQGTYESTTVRSLWDFSRAITNVGLATVLMWGGFNIMARQASNSPYYDVMELLPRVILGALGANLSLEFVRFLIDLNNAFSSAVGQVGLPGYDAATPSQEGIALIFTALTYGIVAILLVFQMLMRMALIDVLIVLAPIASLMWVLPQTQGFSRWWMDLMPVTVFQQAVQMMTLKLGSALMLELTPGSVSNALLTLLLGLAICWLTLKIPSLLRSRGGYQTSFMNVATYVVASRVAGAVAARGAGGAAGAGGAGRAAAGGAR